MKSIFSYNKEEDPLDNKNNYENSTKEIKNL